MEKPDESFIREDDRIKKMLDSEDTDQQEIALMTLLHEGRKTDYIDQLTKYSRSSHDKVRLAAFFVLCKINKKSLIPYLEKGLTDKLAKIRMESAISLSKYKNEKAVPILKGIIKRDIRDHSLHKRAIEALGRYKNKDFITIFEQMLQHRRKVSRIKASQAIAKIPTENAYRILVNAELKEKDPAVKSQIGIALRNYSTF